MADQVANCLTEIMKDTARWIAITCSFSTVATNQDCHILLHTVMNNRNYILSGTVDHTKQIAISSFITICICGI
jgi:hypothetical protein